MRTHVIFIVMTITLTCSLLSIQTYSAHVNNGSTAYAGADTTICIGDCLTLDSASATNYSAFFWATNGDGTFNNPLTLHPEYCPGQGDIQAGTVTLILTVIGTDSFPPVSDTIVITIINCNTGINEAVKEQQFKIYPNPSHGEIIIENPQNEPVQIIDPGGRLLWLSDFQKSRGNRISLTRGLYLVRRPGNQRSIVTKLLIF